LSQTVTAPPAEGASTATPTPPQGALSSTDPDVAAFLAELSQPEAPQASPVEAKAEKAEPAEEEDQEPEKVEAKPETPSDEVKETEDESISRQLNAIRRAKEREEKVIKQQRTEFEAERAKFQDEKKQHQASLAKLEAFERAKTIALADPAEALLSLGWTEDQLELAAQNVYKRSKSATPQMQAEAAQLRRAREQETESQKLAREVRELREQIENERMTAQQQRAVEQFHAGVTKVAEASPYVSKLLKAEPDETRADLTNIAISLHQSGETPTPERCVEVLETRLAAKFKALGIEAPSKTPTQNGRKKPAQSLGNDLSTTTRPRPATSTPEDDIAAFMDDLKAGRIDG
jgi:hypothetical protein